MYPIIYPLRPFCYLKSQHSAVGNLIPIRPAFSKIDKSSIAEFEAYMNDVLG